jgi:palmitoyltransferase ZDHHC13/17
MAAGASSLADQVQSPVGSRSTPPSAPSGKAAAAPPKVTEVHDGVELNSLRNGELSKPTLPIEEDIMQLARLGEVGAMQKLFDSKKFTSKYQDEEGITPLHVSSS